MHPNDPYLDLWGYCDYFMAYAASGINLIAFDLISKSDQGAAAVDAYACERLTRPVLAKSAQGIKRLVRDYAQRNRLGQLEGTAKSLENTLKSNLHAAVLGHLEKALKTEFILAVHRDDSPMVCLILPAIYHACYKEREKTGMGLPPWFAQLYYSLLIKSQKGNIARLEEWEMALQNSFFHIWEGGGSPGEKLKNFFEHKLTLKITSYSLAGIVGFLQGEKEKTYYLFEITHKLQARDMKHFQIMMANGLNGILHKEKRFASRISASGTGQSLHTRILPMDQIQRIVNAAVEKHFDPALDWCVQYQLSVIAEQPRRKLARQADKTFLAMNREIWRELLILADIQRRVICRTRHLLRILIHYLFEMRGTDREFWQKYIPSVDGIIHAAFSEEKDRHRQLNTLLGKRLSLYRNTDKYQGTDWEGFYKDATSRDIAEGVIRKIAQKARSDRDQALPAFWFSSQVEKGVDDRALYRFFRQGPDAA